MSVKEEVVIRYSKEIMISLHDSPLVQKPESMPSLSTWFGSEDINSPTSKIILNGAIITRSTSDKSIILGPTKTNFASSLYGGLKRTDDSIQKSQSLSSRHSRHLEERSNSNSNNNTIKDYRSPRGPSYTGEKGFSHRSLDKSSSERKYNNMGSPPSHHNNSGNNGTGSNKRNDRYLNDNKNGTGRHIQPNNRANNNNNNRHGNNNTSYQEENERVPEWMDYSPENENDAKEEDIQAQFANDLEAWKSNMKKRDGINENPVVAKQAPTNNEKPKKVEDSLASLSLEQQQQESTPLGFFEEQGNNTERRDQKGGSRFAKFFAKREDTPMTTAVVEVKAPQQKQQPPPSHHHHHHQQQQQQQQQPRSISLNDLFQGPSPMQSPAIPPQLHHHQQQQHQQQLQLQQQQQQHYLQQQQLQQQQHIQAQQQMLLQQQQQKNIQVFSEEDILKSLGATHSKKNEKINHQQQQGEDAMGFNRVLQILSQPKPSLPNGMEEEHQQQIIHNNNSNRLSPNTKILPQSNNHHNNNNNNKGSPSMMMMTGSPSDKVSNRFGNNLPTSVLRQMSARSSESRSPSLQSTKSTPPMGYSSPSMKHQQQQQHLPPHLQQQQQQPYFPYQQQQQQGNGGNAYSPGPAMMDQRIFEQMMKFNNGELPPRPLPQFNQQPQRNSNTNEFLPPMMMPPSLPPGQRPMMTPPLHLQQQQQMLHMQQRFPLQQQQQRGDMMMPPHVMANGMPPPMFNKNQQQGWDQRQ